MNKAKTILLSAIIVVIAGGIVYFYQRTDFVAQSSVPQISAWKAYTDATTSYSFRYPASLGKAYINETDWPPRLTVEPGPFMCTEAGSETARAGVTERHTIGGTAYCVTRESEGAAGSIYTMYAYAFRKGNQVAILTFTLRFPQCMNYDDPKQTECQNEEASLDVDSVVDGIARTVNIGQ